jgi:hypothetical protein
MNKQFFPNLLLFLIMTIVLIGCSNSQTLNGTYEITSMEQDGVKVSKEALSKYGANMTLTFSGTDKVVGKITSGDTSDGGEGTYKLDGEKLFLTFEGETKEAKLRDGIIYLEFEGANLVLSKQK